MTEAERIICDFSYDFLEKKWDNIDKGKCDIKDFSKELYLEKVKNNVQDAIWVIFELASWGMDQKYLEEIYIENDLIDLNSIVININGKYIRLFSSSPLSKWEVRFAEKKTIEYWD